MSYIKNLFERNGMPGKANVVFKIEKHMLEDLNMLNKLLMMFNLIMLFYNSMIKLMYLSIKLLVILRP